MRQDKVTRMVMLDVKQTYFVFLNFLEDFVSLQGVENLNHIFHVLALQYLAETLFE